MAKQTRVVVLNETSLKDFDNDWTLYFQYCRYEYSNDTEQLGYRFIWRRPDGRLQAARGQARIPSIADIQELTAKAIREGWGSHLTDKIGHED